MSGTRACLVTREPPDEALRVEPQRNGGASGETRGYQPMAELAEVLAPACEAPELGQAVRRALDHAAVFT